MTSPHFTTRWMITIIFYSTVFPHPTIKTGTFCFWINLKTVTMIYTKIRCKANIFSFTMLSNPLFLTQTGKVCYMIEAWSIMSARTGMAVINVLARWSEKTWFTRACVIELAAVTSGTILTRIIKAMVHFSTVVPCPSIIAKTVVSIVIVFATAVASTWISQAVTDSITIFSCNSIWTFTFKSFVWFNANIWINARGCFTKLNFFAKLAQVTWIAHTIKFCWTIKASSMVRTSHIVTIIVRLTQRTWPSIVTFTNKTRWNVYTDT